MVLLSIIAEDHSCESKADFKIGCEPRDQCNPGENSRFFRQVGASNGVNNA